MSWLHDAAALWWAWMAPMSAQVAALALGLAVVDALLLRRAWPQLRAALWLAVMVKLVMPPTWSSPVSLARLLPPAGTVADTASSGGGVPLPLLVIWLTGLAACAAVLGRRWRQSRRLLAASPAVPAAAAILAERLACRLGLRRVPEFRQVSGVASPAVFGVLRPVVVVPAHLLAPDTEHDLENALLHELAHVKRRDPLRAAVSLVVQLVYWFHPGVWLARSRLATLREIGCDAAVARVLGPDAASYRRTLLGFARRLIEPLSSPRLAFVGPGSQILARLDWLDRPAPRRPRLRALLAVGLFAALLACCVPLAREATAPGPVGFADLQGCLQKRYYVLGLLAREQRQP